MAGQPWSHDDPQLRARLMEALGGTYWWQGEIGLMGACYTEALELWQSIGDKAEIANAYYNASFQYAVPSELTEGTRVDVDRVGETYLRTSLELFREIGDARGAANTLWGLGNYHYFQAFEDLGIPFFGEALETFRAVGDRTMEAWSLHMLGTAQLRKGDRADARDNVSHAMRHFYAASDTAGITLCLDDLSAVAVADGDLERAAILRGAARNLTVITGAGLANYVEDLYETGARPKIVEHMSMLELERLSAQGAAMTLDEAVAYALGGVTADIDDGVTA
jgi:tetratricopeptide (TPR) repeat protein